VIAKSIKNRKRLKAQREFLEANMGLKAPNFAAIHRGY